MSPLELVGVVADVDGVDKLKREEDKPVAAGVVFVVVVAEGVESFDSSPESFGN